MKWGGPVFLGSALLLTLSSGTLIKRDASGSRSSGGDGPLNQKTAGGASMNSASSPTGGTTPGGGTNSSTPGNPLTGPGGLAGQGENREWRGYTPTDVEALRAQLPSQAKYLADSFIATGQKYGIDPLFLVSISRLETGNWTSNAFLNMGNAMGVSNASGAIAQANAAASIDLMGRSLAGGAGTNNYYAGANTVGQVGAIYAPVGASNDGGTNYLWGSTVGQIYDSYVNTLR